jgi:NAD(P)-dependent dehydrogenase (short-subunit alcohol dehydrogenase family)
MNEKKVVLVTGANKGIGYEIAAGLGRQGWVVGVGARDEERREAAVEKLRSAGSDVFGVALDVTDDASVTAAAALIEERFGRLDALVNNAGVTGGWPQEPTRVTPAIMRAALETNVIGVIRVTNALLPLLQRSESPRIVNISSSGASLTRQTTTASDDGWISAAYAPSKTLLNAVTIQYAKELADTNILINLVNPGYTATDLTFHQGDHTPEQAADIAIKYATLPYGGPTGGFFEEEGVVPW